jgi:hypothetical protein
MSKVRGQPRSARHGAAIVLSALLVVVSAISARALAVAVTAAVAAGRSRDGSPVLLALGCLAVGFLMLATG